VQQIGSLLANGGTHREPARQEPARALFTYVHHARRRSHQERKSADLSLDEDASDLVIKRRLEIRYEHYPCVTSVRRRLRRVGCASWSTRGTTRLSWWHGTGH